MILPLLTMAAVVAANAQQPTKVGVLNIQAAIANTQDGKKAAADLESKYAPRRKEVESDQSAINSLKDQLQKGQNTMSETAKAQLIRDIDDKTKRLNRKMEDAQADLQQDQQKALQTIGQKMMVVIDKYAKDHGYTLLIDVSSQQTPVLFAASDIDVTKAIVDLYDKNTTDSATSSVSPAPTAPAQSKPAQHTPSPVAKPK
ncbi:MAG TPA: OmpH family outer membrane protein [Bryobacteraceae bacterium]|jgi:outer membrane protein|nr:OmpH family outer membrane protein [Bryobacteraceae bacterium]